MSFGWDIMRDSRGVGEWGRGSGLPTGKSHNIGFLSNTDPDPLENHATELPYQRPDVIEVKWI